MFRARPLGRADTYETRPASRLRRVSAFRPREPDVALEVATERGEPLSLMSLYARLAPRGKTGFGYGSTTGEVVGDLDLRGRSVLITGTSSGLGMESVRAVLSRGAHVIGTVRRSGSSGPLLEAATYREAICDLADVESIRRCLTELRAERFDAIVANAGIMALPTLERVHGVERQLFTNHVGHFALVTGLLEQLREAGRVVVLTSEAYRMAPRGPIALRTPDARYRPLVAYGTSKLANLLFAKSLARRFAGTRRTANAVHPGVIETNLGRSLVSPTLRAAFALARPLAFKDVAQGAATQCLVAVHPAAEDINGGYWASCNVAPSSARADDVTLAETLWSDTESLLASI